MGVTRVTALRWVDPFHLLLQAANFCIDSKARSTVLMASKHEEKKETQPDVVAIRLEVDDDLCPLPPSVQELEFNSSPETRHPEETPQGNNNSY